MKKASSRRAKANSSSEEFEWYRAAFENAADFIYVIDRRNRVLSVNKSGAAFLNKRREELEGKTLFEVLPGQAASRFSEGIREIFERGGRIDSDSKVTAKGPEFWISSRLSPIVDLEGNVSAVLAVTRDVTEPKQVEKSLRQSEERYRELLDRMLDGIYLSTHEGRFVNVNSAFVKMFGYASKQEMLDIQDIRKALYFSPEERGSHILDTGQEDVELYRMRRKDGSEIWVEDHGRYVHDEQGNVIYHEGMLRDVTARKCAEEELIESEKRYRSLFQTMLEGFAYCKMILDDNDTPVDFVYLDVNSAFSELTGLEGVVGKRVTEVIPGIRESNPELFEVYGRVASTGKPERFEIEVNPLSRSFAISVTSPRKGYFVAVFENITERKRAEAKLLTLHNHAQQLASAGTLDEVIEHTLDAMEFTLGFTSAEFWLVDALRGRILREGARGMASAIMEFSLDGPGVTVKAVNTGRTIKVVDSRREGAYVDEEGRAGKGKLPVKLSELAVPVLIANKVVALLDAEKIPADAFTDEDQSLLETLATHVKSAMTRLRHEDELQRYSQHLEELVTERSGELAESEARYRRFFESSPISLWEEDFSKIKVYFDQLRAAGVKDLRAYLTEHPEEISHCASIVKIVNVNEATLGLYGAKSGDELRVELRRIFTREFENNFKEELIALGQGKGRFESEFDNLTLTGETKHVSLILTVVPGYEDNLAKVLVAIIDLTERKKMEQRLQQVQRLAAIGETAAMVGHDLRNPLQGIAGAAHLLKDEALTEKERTELLQLIQSSVAYADGIIKDLLDYSGGIQLRLTEVTPKSIVLGAMAAIDVPSNVAMMNLSEDQPILRVDVEKIRRIFINFAQNAIDAMPDGGIITIKSRRSAGYVEMEFSDTGCGMPENILESFGTPFQTTKAKGMGLGLAICKRIVDAHGGNMSVSSKVGNGTAITVRLPMQTEVVEVKPK